MSSKMGLNANAQLFLTDLKSNTNLRNSWTQLVDKITSAVKKAKEQGQSQYEKTYKEALQAADNFLVDQGYNTTAEAVFTLLKSPFYQQHIQESKPNADSDRFVQILLTNGKIYQAWQSLLLEVGGGSQNIDALNTYLSKGGYKCNYMQVQASFVKMRNHNISYWSGAYQTSKQLLEKGKPTGDAVDGPVIVVYGSKTISVDDQSLEFAKNLQYNNGTLSWDSYLNLNFSGSLVFSEITLPSKSSPYKGPLFNGQLSYSKEGPFDPFKKKPTQKKVYQVLGELTPKPKNISVVPAGEHPSELEKIAKWVNYLLIGMSIIKFVGSMGKRINNVKDFEQQSDRAFGNRLENTVEQGQSYEQELKDLTSSPLQDIDFAGSNVLQDLQEKIAEQEKLGNKEMAEKYREEYKTQEETEDDYDDLPNEEANPEGDGWGGSLGEILEGAA